MEELLFVHGESGSDPTDPPRSKTYPYPPVPHEPYIAELKGRLERQGLHPFFLPMGVDLGPHGRCIRCKTCDGFPCQVHAKGEADTCLVRPALESGNVELLTNTFVRRLKADPRGKTVVSAEAERQGKGLTIYANTFVVSCGAANSAAL